MIKKRFLKEYCGKKYGLKEYFTGFAIGFVFGFIASAAMYGNTVVCVAFSTVSGFFSSFVFVKNRIKHRKKLFISQFCDYLDSLSGVLSCGKNAHDSFLSANGDMHELFGKASPICCESQKLVRGLSMGRSIEELLYEMGKNSLCEEAQIFADVYSMCNLYGGNLKEIVIDSKNTLLEKTAIEAEIGTALAGPKNELNIMAAMPFVITACMRFFKVGGVSGEVTLLSIFITCVFLISYAIGLKIVDIKV